MHMDHYRASRTDTLLSIVILLLLVLIVGGAWVYITHAPEAVAQDTERWMRVEQGDTLWELAGEYYPDMDRGEALELIREANPHVEGDMLYIGMGLRMPKEERVYRDKQGCA